MKAMLVNDPGHVHVRAFARRRRCREVASRRRPNLAHAGKIIAVEVRQGDRVAKGQKLADARRR
jgi:multidrug efflux pump subunit AcrA (membrane-fusion protein)